MTLPSEYLQLEYIQSSGTQCIDTGFKHNQNTRVVMDVLPLSQSANSWLFEGRISSSSASKGIFYYYSSTKKWSADYNNSSNRYAFSAGETDRLKIDYNKNTCTVNGISNIWTQETFQSTANLFLLACNTNGEISGYANAKLYSCQIYDNGTLVRDFVPVEMTSVNEIGLYDLVNDVFYQNAGTGTFTGKAGTDHRTLIDGTGYDVSGGTVMIDGTCCSIKKGRTFVEGTGYDISFGTPLSEFSVKDSVYLNENGVPIEFIVIHKGNPNETKYGASCDGVWLLRKNTYQQQKWGSDSAVYSGSYIDTYLNDTYKALLDENVQNVLISASLPYMTSHTNPSTLGEVTAQVFLLSVAEVNPTPTTTCGYVDGVELDYFASISDSEKTGYFNGSKVSWLTRSLVVRNLDPDYYTKEAAAINTYGSINVTYKSDIRFYSRPALILPYDVLVDDNNIVIG